LDEGVADIRDCGKEVGDDGCPSERHLSPGKDVSHEGGYYYEQKKNNPDVSGFFVQVGAVV